VVTVAYETVVYVKVWTDDADEVVVVDVVVDVVEVVVVVEVVEGIVVVAL
jgi:hypothetical protein